MTEIQGKSPEIPEKIGRNEITIDFLMKIAKSPNEIGIIVYREEAHIETNNSPEEIQMIPEYGKPVDFMIHSHPEHAGDQPSIADLNSAELYQLYGDPNNTIRFFIITVRGITEYRIPKELAEKLLKTGNEFRNYYSQWLKQKYGGNIPDGKTISTDFNTEHGTYSFYPWESEEAKKIVSMFQGNPQ